jgi:hypothetical protein
VHFYEGKADAIQYQKLEMDALRHPVKMSDNETETLRKANIGNREYKKNEVISADETLVTTDGAMFTYQPWQKNCLVIMTKGYVERGEAEKKATEDKTLGGF